MSNREILFRGKRYDGVWTESRYPFGEIHAGVHTCDYDLKTVGQSTAMKDNNGNRIFEDDILRFTLYGHTYAGVVTYKKGAFLVVLTEPLRYSFCMAATVSLDEAIRYGAVVVGNIHNNPELLEE